MAMYQKILMALDFHSDNDQIIQKGLQIAQENNANLYLLHVNEPLPVAYSVEGMGFSDQVVSLETNIKRESQQKMVQLGAELNVPVERQIIREGSPASEIHNFVEQEDIGLIVMGTHGQSGFQLLLGSTANSVLHGVSCDVLTIRINK